MTLAELIRRAKEQLNARIAARNEHTTSLNELRSHEGFDAARESELVSQRAAVDAEIEVMRQRVSDLEAELRQDEAVARLQSEITPEATVAGRSAETASVRVGAEPRTYSAGAEREGVHFLRDFLTSSFANDYAAQQRLARHMQEERVDRAHLLTRDVGTAAFSGLTIPQYLVGELAPLARAGRPLADNCRQLPLPADGMVINIPRITTGTTAAVQATEAAGVSETDIDDTTLAVNVRTIAGQQDVSWQSLARSVGSEQVVLQDLIAAYHTKLDSAIINDDGTSGTHLGIRSTVSISTATLTDSSPTPAEAIGSLYAIQSTIESAVFKNPTHLVMSPRRWHWFRSAVGTDVALIGQGTAYPPQALGVSGNGEYGPGIRGDLAGLPVIVDGNIPLTVNSDQDVILAVNVNELFLWEDPSAPLFIRAEQPGAGNLMTKLVVYGFSAFTAGRYPAAHGVISGTGLAAPTVFGKAIS